MNEKFYFIANSLALDFTNTLIADEKGEPWDLLRSANDLNAWLSAAGLSGSKQAVNEPFLLQRALAFRGELKKMAKAVSEGKTVPKSAIDAINDVLSRSKGHFVLSSINTGYTNTFQVDSQSAGDLLLPIAQSAARLLSDGDLGLIRKCQREACVLYFYDTSKRHGRQWCSMSACGNRAKAAAHYKRGRNS